MRTFWNILAFISVVNLLVLAIGGGWLWWSGRLDEHRIRAVRQLFVMPAEEVEALRTEFALKEAEAAERALEERRWGQIPVTSVHAIDEAERWNDLGISLQGRLEEQAIALDSGITARLNARVAVLEARERRLLAGERRLQERLDAVHDADFRAMVTSLSQLDEEDALAILLGYIQQGREHLVVTVLAALEEDVRTELIAEFIKANQAELAGRLLLELRERGTDATTSTESVNASTNTNAGIAVAGNGARSDFGASFGSPGTPSGVARE